MGPRVTRPAADEGRNKVCCNHAHQSHQLQEGIRKQVAWYATTATAYIIRSDDFQQQSWADGLLLQRVRLGYCTREELYDGFKGQECAHYCTTFCPVWLPLSSDSTATTHPACMKAKAFSPTARWHLRLSNLQLPAAQRMVSNSSRHATDDNGNVDLVMEPQKLASFRRLSVNICEDS
ncbi:hypothetical protein E2C01_046195 [Portunus trituberculatus]|uniref:Uncharacterized protein n=1 Tax=Portunus trituberculatus TaxID=210409 RepID=A0A5B7FX75_PORTR|nr:hypothetical protein [Portunus trituberculatus]